MSKRPLPRLLAILLAVAGSPSCKTSASAGASVKSPTDRPAASDQAAASDIVTYAELCKKELGVQKPIPPMNCLSGTEVGPRI